MSAIVGIIMGSDSDLDIMQAAATILKEFEIPAELTIVSAHRTPLRMLDYAGTAKERGLKVIIAGAGGAAHLPGMAASMTTPPGRGGASGSSAVAGAGGAAHLPGLAASMTTLPVLGVPIESNALKGIDSLLSIVQMPAGVPVGTLAIGKAGAINAALLAAAMLAGSDEQLSQRLDAWREQLTGS